MRTSTSSPSERNVPSLKDINDSNAAKIEEECKRKNSGTSKTKPNNQKPNFGFGFSIALLSSITSKCSEVNVPL